MYLLDKLKMYVEIKINNLILDKYTLVDIIDDNENILGTYYHNDNIEIKKDSNFLEHTILHEMLHSTGHVGRLNRFSDNKIISYCKQLMLPTDKIEVSLIKEICYIIEESIVENCIYLLDEKKYLNLCINNDTFRSFSKFHWNTELAYMDISENDKEKINNVIQKQSKLVLKTYKKYLFYNKIRTLLNKITTLSQ